MSKWSRVWSLVLTTRLPHSFDKKFTFGTRLVNLCIIYVLLCEEAYVFIYQWKLLELLVYDTNVINICEFKLVPLVSFVEIEQLQLVFFVSCITYTITLPFHSSFLFFPIILPLVISFSKRLSPILHKGLAGVQGLNMD